MKQQANLKIFHLKKGSPAKPFYVVFQIITTHPINISVYVAL